MLAVGEHIVFARSDRLMAVTVDHYRAGNTTTPETGTLDTDDTVDIVHKHQLLSLNAHYYQRCFLPIQIYDWSGARLRGRPHVEPPTLPWTPPP